MSQVARGLLPLFRRSTGLLVRGCLFGSVGLIALQFITQVGPGTRSTAFAEETSAEGDGSSPTPVIEPVQADTDFDPLELQKPVTPPPEANPSPYEGLDEDMGGTDFLSTPPGGKSKGKGGENPDLGEGMPYQPVDPGNMAVPGQTGGVAPAAARGELPGAGKKSMAKPSPATNAGAKKTPSAGTGSKTNAKKSGEKSNSKAALSKKKTGLHAKDLKSAGKKDKAAESKKGLKAKELKSKGSAGKGKSSAGSKTKNKGKSSQDKKKSKKNG